MSADVNAMSVLGRELLLVETGGGEIHAAAVSAEEDRRAAVNVDIERKLPGWRSSFD